MTVALQCLGNWRWFTQVEETPLLHWLLGPSDIGGLAWKESTSLVVQQVVGWFVLVAGAIVLWRPVAAILVALTLIQIAITVAMWQIADGYSLQLDWVPARYLTLFPFATQLLRIAAPLGLLLLSQNTGNKTDFLQRSARTMLFLRWATAIVFVAHGIEAIQLNPKFVDLIIGTTQSTLGISLAQTTAEHCLAVIGVIDVLVAVACVSVRWTPLMCWLTFWGGITALSRILANGWDLSWHESLTRTPHFGVPLAVVLWLQLIKSEQAAVEAVKDSITTQAGSHQSASITT